MNLKIGVLLMWGLAFFVGLPGVSLAQEARPGIVVWKLKANEGVKTADVELISNFVTNQVAKYSGAKVISESDIRTILKGEETRQQCGAEDTSCVAEIGAALGVPEAVSGDIGRLGEIWMLNLRRINVRSAEVISRSSRQVEGKVDDLVLALPGAVAELFGVKVSDQPGIVEVVSEPAGAMVRIDGKDMGPTPLKQRLPEGEYKLEVVSDGHFTETRKVTVRPGEREIIRVMLEPIPMNPYRKAAYGAFFAGVGLAAFGGIATWQSKEAGDDYNYSGKSSDQDRGRSWAGVAIAGYTLGGAAMITGIVLWIIDPGDKEWAERQQVSVSPGPDGRGVSVMLSGRW